MVQMCAYVEVVLVVATRRSGRLACKGCVCGCQTLIHCWLNAPLPHLVYSDKEHIRREREQKHEQRTEEDHRLFTDEEDEEIEYLIHAANFL